MEVLFLILGTVLGAIVSVIISRYYYYKQVDKKITPYIQLASPLLRGTDPNIRKSLKIQYQGTEVKDLFDLQIIVANEGHRSIRGYLKPLSLTLPPGIKVIDTSVLHTKPGDREVSTKTATLKNGLSRVDFEFPILNSGDYFLVKILLDGVIEPRDLTFHITDDDLPSEIQPVLWPTFRLVPGQDTETKERKPSKINIAVSAILFFLFPVFGLTSVVIWIDYLSSSYIGQMRAIFWLLFIVFVILTIMSIVTSILTFISFFDLERAYARRKFSLPNNIDKDEGLRKKIEPPNKTL